jgi:hypothetical protein
MLDDQSTSPSSLEQALALFFHLPTMLAVALLGLVILWQMYDIGLDVDLDFFRINSNRGNITLFWGEGCCDLRW